MLGHCHEQEEEGDGSLASSSAGVVLDHVGLAQEGKWMRLGFVVSWARSCGIPEGDGNFVIASPNFARW